MTILIVKIALPLLFLLQLYLRAVQATLHEYPAGACASYTLLVVEGVDQLDRPVGHCRGQI